MNDKTYTTVVTLGNAQEIATRAVMLAAGEDIMSKPAEQVAEDVSVRIAKNLSLTGSATS